jgi:hypothetical protein
MMECEISLTLHNAIDIAAQVDFLPFSSLGFGVTNRRRFCAGCTAFWAQRSTSGLE